MNNYTEIDLATGPGVGMSDFRLNLADEMYVYLRSQAALRFREKPYIAPYLRPEVAERLISAWRSGKAAIKARRRATRATKKAKARGMVTA